MLLEQHWWNALNCASCLTIYIITYIVPYSVLFILTEEKTGWQGD